MISYAPLWKVLSEKGLSTYTLINQYQFNPRTISRLKHNKGITVYTLERICKILDVTPNDVIEFTEE